MIRRHVVVTGRVQGVFFRASAEQEAGRHGVDGWVRNRADGAVELEVEGSACDVDAVVDWCRHGPPRAAVDHVEVTDVDPTGDTGFVVRD